eukprot:CAMPEP_0206016932 /NCGR_PEP_ID=MMETSP1464-20131121/23932_1 /ASSEMBLY_ACC=CAM_ASM_001124 /TAXON_ID=119497 /ORGANISM="Exanthemachrysis gayraliae, Strain RCC1523" /LENGTH=220 /DNA_ID=CAMNT_0053390763 /DNA_START=135 /DNA_END=796 /DNA_ORIENTATION=-
MKAWLRNPLHALTPPWSSPAGGSAPQATEGLGDPSPAEHRPGHHAPVHPAGGRVEVEALRQLVRGQGAGQVLLVGEDEEGRVAELLGLEEAAELLARGGHARAVRRVHHEDHAAGWGGGVPEVRAPQGPQRLPPSQVVRVKCGALVLQHLHASTDSGHHAAVKSARSHALQQRRLARSVEAHEDEARGGAVPGAAPEPAGDHGGDAEGAMDHRDWLRSVK